MDVVHSCRCCLRRAPDKDLTTPYTYLGNTEIYSDMLKECFEIHLKLNNDKVGICEVCVGRLRDASEFKLQVQHSQTELQAALPIKDEEPPVKLEFDESNIMLHEEYIIKSELEEQQGASESEMLNEEPAVKSEVSGDAASDDDCASLMEVEQVRPVHDVSCVRVEHLHGDEAPRASQTCLATSRHGPRRASRMKDLPDDTAGLRAEEQAYTCDTCGEQFTDKSRLIKHIQAHGTPAEELSCMNIYTQHAKTHMSNRTDNYSDMYDAKFSAQSFLNSHVGTHKDGKRYPCEVCNKTFVNLTKHKKIHTVRKPFTCDECNKQYQSKGNFIAHVRYIHTGIKRYSCKECNKQFTLKQHLDIHKIVHTGVKPYSCELCNKQFTQKGNLNRHRKIHNGEKPYGCEECGKHFIREDHLDYHKKIHTGEKPYSCKECNKQFTHKYSIIRHMRVHTRDTLL